MVEVVRGGGGGDGGGRRWMMRKGVMAKRILLNCSSLDATVKSKRKKIIRYDLKS